MPPGWGHGRHYCRKQGWQPAYYSMHQMPLLVPHLLLLLRDAPAHGYTLLDQLRDFGFALNPVVVYRALREMENDGLVASTIDEMETQGPPRRVYRLTADGKRALEFWAEDLDKTQQVIVRFLKRFRA